MDTSLNDKVPKLRWRTFRYWAVRATDAQDMGSSPGGGKGHFFININTITTTQLHCKQASSQLEAHPQHKPKAKLMYV
jgi:hypothetical protein